MTQYRDKIRSISQLIEQSDTVNNIVATTRNFSHQHKITIAREISSIQRQHENVSGSIYQLQDIYEGWKEQQNELRVREENHQETQDIFEKNKQELEQMEQNFKTTYERITKQHEQLEQLAIQEREQTQIAKAQVYDTVQVQLNKFCHLLQNKSNQREDFGQKFMKKVKQSRDKCMQTIKQQRVKRQSMNDSVLKIIEEVCNKLQRRAKR